MKMDGDLLCSGRRPLADLDGVDYPPLVHTGCSLMEGAAFFVIFDRG